MIKSLISTTLFFIFLIAPFSLRANESLRFQAPVSYKEKQVVSFVTEQDKTAQTAYVLTPIDLNDDAIFEYIVRPQGADICRPNKLCPHFIIAFQERQPIMIGQFDAHKMLVSGKKDYGIRQIIVYNNSYNDFENSTARWTPFAFRFELP